MGEEDNRAPGLVTLLRRIGQTGLGALRNRAELVALEWQEEKARLVHVLVWSLSLVFFALLAAGFLTATIIVLIPANYRVWAFAGFTILYAGAAAFAYFTLRSHLKREPFSESIEQLRKDGSMLEAEE